VIATLVARKHIRCRCGKVFERHTSLDVMAAHVRIAPSQCRIDLFFMCAVATEPGETEQEIERNLGVPASMIDLDPPVGGLYYGWFPTWRKHIEWSG
jgi:hypothetical protein